MKRILFIFILLMGISQANDKANDKDGIFLGFELGFGGVKTTSLGDDFFGGGDANTYTTATMSLPLYGFRLGYVKYFGDLFGINTYANFRHLFQSTKIDGSKDSTHIMSFAANIDFLLDFYNNKSLSMGGFVGVGIGSTSTKERQGLEGHTAKNTMYGLYTDLKLGLKASYEHNSMSLIAAFPVIPTKEGSYKSRTNYTISLAYDYKF